jgi:HSP20 family protein
MALPVLRRNHHDRDRREQSAERSPETWSSPAERLPARWPAGSQPGRWDPFAEFADLHERMGRLLQEAFGAPGSGPWSLPLPGGGWRPAADVEETADAYLVEIDLPGVKRPDVSVELSPGELVVTGELKETERVGWLRTRTRRTGRFDYRVSLPADIDADQVSADLSDGVLTVRVPKTERSRRRRIAINT